MYRYTSDAGTHHLFTTAEVRGETGTSLCGAIESDGPFVRADVDELDGDSLSDWCTNCLNAVTEEEDA